MGCWTGALPAGPAQPETLGGRVAVYAARIPADFRPDDAGPLSPGELARSRSLGSEAERREYVAARLFLRSILAFWLKRPASDITIIAGTSGKPRIADGGLEFSLSHRAGWCAVAVADAAAVGVDVEPIRSFPGMQDVAQHFFPPQGVLEYCDARTQEKAGVFTLWWVRIEAALKARGLGLDAARRCFEGVVCRSMFLQPEGHSPTVALAAAAMSAKPLRVDWNIETDGGLAGKTGLESGA